MEINIYGDNIMFNIYVTNSNDDIILNTNGTGYIGDEDDEI